MAAPTAKQLNKRINHAREIGAISRPLDSEGVDKYIEDRDTVAKMVSEGYTQAQVAERLEITTPRVSVLHRAAKTTPVNYDSLNELKEIIVKARDEEGVSWDEINNRLPELPKGAIHRLYADASGQDHRASVLGLGGRVSEQYAHLKPAKQEREEPEKEPEKPKGRKKSAKPEPEKESESGESVTLDGLNKSQIKERVEGATITVTPEDGEAHQIEVDEIVRFGTAKGSGRVMLLTDSAGEQHTVPLKQVTAVEW